MYNVASVFVTDFQLRVDISRLERSIDYHGVDCGY